MKYFYVEPEVSGGLGANTVMDRSVHPPVVSHLHYQFEGWLGDVLLESFPSFIVTEEAKGKLQEVGATGARFGEVEITTSDQFKELYPDKQLPGFTWLQIAGTAGHDDFGTAADGRLVVSERALDVLKGLELSNALIDPF
jgi:hypothetical protein